jgi:hypothetical protein
MGIEQMDFFAEDPGVDNKVGDARRTGVEAGERIVDRAHRQEQKSLQPSFAAISTSFSAKASNSMSRFPQFLAGRE